MEYIINLNILMTLHQLTQDIVKIYYCLIEMGFHSKLKLTFLSLGNEWDNE